MEVSFCAFSDTNFKRRVESSKSFLIDDAPMYASTADLASECEGIQSKIPRGFKWGLHRLTFRVCTELGKYCKFSVRRAWLAGTEPPYTESNVVRQTHIANSILQVSFVEPSGEQCGSLKSIELKLCNKLTCHHDGVYVLHFEVKCISTSMYPIKTNAILRKSDPSIL